MPLTHCAVTEDYSEYESVDEEEPEPTKDKGRKEGSGTDNKADKSSKGKGSKKSAQSNLANFFGAPAKAIPKK